MFKSILAAIARAIGNASHFMFTVADEIVSFPFRLIAFHNQRRAAAAAAQSQAQNFEEQNAAMRKAMMNSPAALKTPNPAEAVDSLDKKAYLIQRYAECVAEEKPLPDIRGLDMKFALWCLSMRNDRAAAEAVKGASMHTLVGHLTGKRPSERLHPMPGEERVKKANAAYDRAVKIIDDLEASAIKVA